MPYQSKAECYAGSLMTWSMLIEHVRFRSVQRCDENEARRQIGNAIAEGNLHVRWEDQAKIPFGSAASQVQVSTPPRDATYWLKCEIDPTDPDRVREPPPYDSDLVDKRTAKRLDKTRRFRTPMFRRDQVLRHWPQDRGSTTAVYETLAIAFLGEKLKKDSELRREDAFTMCRQQFPRRLTGRGLHLRVWPRAREAAGLPPVAPAGAKPKRKPQSVR